MLLISDSICKHFANIDWLEVIVIPGANIFSIHQYILENKAHIKILSHLTLHVGTNDITNRLSAISFYSTILTCLISFSQLVHVMWSFQVFYPVLLIF